MFAFLTTVSCDIDNDLMGNNVVSGVTGSANQGNKPHWACAVSVRDEYRLDKISFTSPDIRAINSNTIEHTGNGNSRTECARWSRGLTSGKHIFEFIYPVKGRGPGSYVGLVSEGTLPVEYGVKETMEPKETWALDLAQRRAIHNGKNMTRFPARKAGLPDWFFMYVDLDLGQVHFGSDGEFYGTAFTGVTVGAGGRLYPMVTLTQPGAVASIVYRGQGKEVTGPLRKKRALPAGRTSRARVDSWR